MNTNNSAIAPPVPPCTAVSDLLTRAGVPEKSWSSTIANLMGWHFQTATRRMANQETFTLEDLLKLATHYQTTVSAMLQAAYPGEAVLPNSHAAHLRIGTAEVACQVITKPTAQARNSALVAVEEPAGWMVYAAAEAPASTRLHAVLQLQIASHGPAPMQIAVVDDEAPKTLVRFLNGFGFAATHFSETAPVLALLESAQRPDAYVLDWILGHGETSRKLIEAIRQVDRSCPIVLLTGTIQSRRANQSEIAEVVGTYNVEFYEKPTKLPILAEKLRAMLDRQLQLPSLAT
jgi:CheY-like chemotaxis protein